MAFVEVNDQCNLGCTFCGIARHGEAARATTIAHLQRAAEQGETTVTFGGGEPTLASRLDELLTRARELDFEQRQVETNSIRFVDAAYLARLQAAGLTHARLMLPAADTDTWNAVTQVADRLELAWRGARALADAGVELSVVVPINRANAGHLDEIVERIAGSLPQVTSVSLRPVFFEPPPTGQQGQQSALAPELVERAKAETLPAADLTPILVRAISAGVREGLDMRLDAAGVLPLCALRGHTDAIARLVGQPRGERQTPEGCTGCALLERCGGQAPVARAAHGNWRPRPFGQVPRKVRGASSSEPLLLFSRGLPAMTRPVSRDEKAEIRVTMPCNQRCTFCFVNRDAPDASGEELDAAVDGAIDRQVGAIVFTGGEPTLSPHLPRLIERAATAGVPCVGIQTNALRCDGPLAEELVAAGLNHAHVSLHSADLDRYLRITGHGSPESAIRGAARLRAAGAEISFSLVLCQDNVEGVEETVALMYAHAPDATVVLSVAREQPEISTRPWDSVLLRYSDAATAFVRTLDACQALGLAVVSAGTCAFPPCVLAHDDLARLAPMVAVTRRKVEARSVRQQDRFDDEELRSRLFLERCERCDLKEYCPGIHDAYLERFGEAEFQALDRQELHVGRAIERITTTRSNA